MPAIRGSKSKSKTRRKTRDVDQVHADLRNPRQLAQLKALIPEEEKPGLGLFHCVECARYFESEYNMSQHKKGKVHKRRVKDLAAEPYSQKEADAAAGLGQAAFYEALELKKDEALLENQTQMMGIE